jgi:hypothetical protein
MEGREPSWRVNFKGEVEFRRDADDLTLAVEVHLMAVRQIVVFQKVI